MSRWVKTLFIISLALNFAVIGAMAGHRLGLWRGKHHHGLHHHLLKEIPEAKRAQAAKIIEDYKKAYPRKRGRLIFDWSKIEELLTEETFNRDAFLTAFNAEIDEHNKRFYEGGKSIADIAALLTQEERKAIVATMKTKWEQRRKFKRH